MEKWAHWSFSEEGKNILLDLTVEQSMKEQTSVNISIENCNNASDFEILKDHCSDKLVVPSDLKMYDTIDPERDSTIDLNIEVSDTEIEEIVASIISYVNASKEDEVQNMLEKCDAKYIPSILENVMLEITEDAARTILFAGLIQCNKPNLNAIANVLFTRWSSDCDYNISPFMECLLDVMNAFPHNICEVISPIINCRTSILVTDRQIFSDLLSHISLNSRLQLFKTYVSNMKQPVEQWQLSILLTLLESCNSVLDDVFIIQQIVALCSQCAAQYNCNRDFGNILLCIATNEACTEGMKNEIKTIAAQIKGLIKHKILKT